MDEAGENPGKRLDHLTTLDAWQQWLKRCEVAKCDESERFVLGYFIAKRLERIIGYTGKWEKPREVVGGKRVKVEGAKAVQVLVPCPELAEGYRVDAGSDNPYRNLPRAAHEFDTHLRKWAGKLAQKDRKPVLKLWNAEGRWEGQVPALEDFEQAASLVVRDRAYVILRENGRTAGKVAKMHRTVSLDQDTGDHRALKDQIADPVAAEGRDDPTEAELRELAARFFDQLSTAQRAGLWGDRHGLKRSVAVALSGLKSSRFAEAKHQVAGVLDKVLEESGLSKPGSPVAMRTFCELLGKILDDWAENAKKADSREGQ